MATASTDANSHSIVLDAKAFRLSRTALNPKDYKIEALSRWRREADYAVLVGPVAGFPEGNSRLFLEAARFSVTLLTFSHLAFLLRLSRISVSSLGPLWGAARTLPTSFALEPAARDYWLHVDQQLCMATGASMLEWRAYRKQYFATLLAVAERQVDYYLDQERRIRQMSQEALATLAIRALKIEGHIATIRQRATRTQLLLDAVDPQDA